MSRSAVWIDAVGELLSLDGDDGYTLLSGALGLEAPPSGLNLSPLLSADGSTLGKRRHPHRPIVLPLLLSDGDVGAMVDRAALAFQGPGTLRVAHDDRTRDLTNVIYETGLEGDDGAGRAFRFDWRKRVVSLLALDPWWYGETRFVRLAMGAETDFDAGDVDFDDPLIGFDGSTSTSVSVDGSRNSAVSPVVTIRGPFTTCRVGIAGGQSFALAEPLASGALMVVDSRPGSRGPRMSGGQVDWSLLTPPSRLWDLPRGESVLTTSVTGEDSDSLIEVSFRERWLTP